MPIKVVSDAPVKTKKVVCTKCAYELEYSGEDLQEHVGDDVWYTITCPRPSCGHKVRVKSWNNGRD